MEKNDFTSVTTIDVAVPRYFKGCYLSYDMLNAQYVSGMISPSYGDAYCVLTKNEEKDEKNRVIRTSYTYDDKSKMYIFTEKGFIETNVAVGKTNTKDQEKSHKYKIYSKKDTPKVKESHRSVAEVDELMEQLKQMTKKYLSILSKYEKTNPEIAKRLLNLKYGTPVNFLDTDLLTKKPQRQLPLIINIEGIDAVGKATTTSRLHAKLTELGYKGKIVSFPRYDSEFGIALKKVLMGECGDSSTLDPSLISPLYTLDRIAYFKSNLKEIEKNYDYLICDRSFYSNFIYQGSKLTNSELYTWLPKQYELEFETTGLDKYTTGRMKTYVLMLDDESNKTQLASRGSLDCNEKNTEYLDKCRWFTRVFSSYTYKTNFKTLRNSKHEKYDLPYLTSVMPIMVKHAETPDKINDMVDESVHTIINDILLMKLL